MIKKNITKRNKEIIKRLKNGEDLKLYSTYDSWFPPRPVIKKDKNLIKKLTKHKDNIKSDNIFDIFKN